MDVISDGQSSISVSPTRQIRSLGYSLLDAVENLGQVLRVVMQAREIVGQRGVAVPAVLGARAVGHFAAIGWVGRGVEKVLHTVDGIVQEVGIFRADIDVNLASEFGAQLRPVSFENFFNQLGFKPKSTSPSGNGYQSVLEISAGRLIGAVPGAFGRSTLPFDISHRS